MAGNIEKLKARLEQAEADEKKAEAAKKKAARKKQLIVTQMSKQERRDDTRRKILRGSWAADKAEKSPEFHAEMQHELNRVWLVRDDDRMLFGLEPLSDSEKAARGIALETAKRGRKPKEKTSAPTSTRAENRESEAA